MQAGQASRDGNIVGSLLAAPSDSYPHPSFRKDGRLRQVGSMTDPIAVLKRLYPQPNDKALWWMHLAVSTLPLLWVMLMCVYCLDVLLRLGHWPRPMVEAGPQDMFSSFLEAVTGILYLPEMYLLLVWLPLRMYFKTKGLDQVRASVGTTARRRQA